jgi:hypothetical protein
VNVLTAIYERVEDMARLGQIEAIDAELTSIRVDETDTDTLLAFLTATLIVRSRLPSRPALYLATKRAIRDRGHWEPGIMDGLR